MPHFSYPLWMIRLLDQTPTRTTEWITFVAFFRYPCSQWCMWTFTFLLLNGLPWNFDVPQRLNPNNFDELLEALRLNFSHLLMEIPSPFFCCCWNWEILGMTVIIFKYLPQGKKHFPVVEEPLSDKCTLVGPGTLACIDYISVVIN